MPSHDDFRSIRSVKVEVVAPSRARSLGGALRGLGYIGRGVSYFFRGNPRALLGALLLAVLVAAVPILLSHRGLAIRQTSGEPVRQASGSSSPDLVKRVVDGDTIELGDGRRIRIIGIDAPERNARLGAVATARVAELAAGHLVRLEFDGPRSDRYGRILAHVWIGDALLAEVLAREGLATVALFASSIQHADRLLAGQEIARRARVGVWASIAPPPGLADHD